MAERRQSIDMGTEITGIDTRKKAGVIVQYLDRAGKIRIDLGPDRQDLSLDIDEVITQFYRAKNKTPFRNDTSSEQHYMANCRSATKDFGQLLSKQADEEGNEFFKRFPGTNYYDFESSKPSKGTYAQYDFHSIGFLEIPSRKEPATTLYVAIDLTYYANGGKDNARTLVAYSTEKNEILQELGQIYGSNKWDIYRLNSTKGTYEYTE